MRVHARGAALPLPLNGGWIPALAASSLHEVQGWWMGMQALRKFRADFGGSPNCFGQAITEFA